MWAPPSDIYIGNIQIHLYSVFFALGLLLGYLLARSFALDRGIKEKDFDGTFLLVLFFGLIGARLFFVFGNWEIFRGDFGEILRFWNGGLAFYGGVIGGFVGISVGYVLYKFRILEMLDSLSIGLPIGQAIGRLGNFFNQEAYGEPTDLPWAIYIEPERRLPEFQNFNYYHPTFLYESVVLLVIFLILLRVSKHYKIPGVIFAVYAILSGLARFFIENVRVDALVLNGLKISQIAAIVLMSTGIILFIHRRYERKVS